MTSRLRLNTRSFGKLFSFWNVFCVFWRVLQVLSILYYSYQPRISNVTMTTVEVVALGVVWFSFSLRFWGLHQCGCICGRYCFQDGCSLFGCSFHVTSGQFFASQGQRPGIQELLILFNISNFMQILFDRECWRIFNVLIRQCS